MASWRYTAHFRNLTMWYGCRTDGVGIEEAIMTVVVTDEAKMKDFKHIRTVTSYSI